MATVGCHHLGVMDGRREKISKKRNIGTNKRRDKHGKKPALRKNRCAVRLSQDDAPFAEFTDAGRQAMFTKSQLYTVTYSFPTDNYNNIINIAYILV